MLRRLRRVGFAGALALLLVACGGGGSSGGGTSAPPVVPIAITSGATASVAENGVGTVYQLTTTGGSGTPAYTLGGVDAALFSIDTAGALTFRAAPDFEQPADADRNNSYIVTITVADASGTTSREVTITVTNVADATVVTALEGSYANAAALAALPGQAGLLLAQRNGDVYLIDPAGGTRGRLYVQTGGILQVRGVAASADFATSGVIYVSVFNNNNNNLEIRRYDRTPAPAGEFPIGDVILSIPYPKGVLNSAGWIGFGPDRLLYVTTGNGADSSTNPPSSNTSLLGKVLRIDPSRDDFPADPLRDYGIPAANPFATGGGAGEVYASGFRDPTSGGFDGTTLYASDRYEGSSGFAYLYAIRPADAGRAFAPAADGAGAILPVLSAQNNLFAAATIVAGKVYRGPSPDLNGRYVFWANGGTGANNFDGIYTVPAASLVPGAGLALRGCCTLFNSRQAVAFAEDDNRTLYFAIADAVYAIQYR